MNDIAGDNLAFLEYDHARRTQQSVARAPSKGSIPLLFLRLRRSAISFTTMLQPSSGRAVRI